MDSVYVIGVGMIRFGKYLDGSVRVMAGQALDLVLADAGLDKRRYPVGICIQHLLGHVRKPAFHQGRGHALGCRAPGHPHREL